MNTVVQKFTADGISVIGGIPSMTSSVEEVEAFVAKTDALAVYLSTLDHHLPGLEFACEKAASARPEKIATCHRDRGLPELGALWLHVGRVCEGRP
jgi:hydroxyethylthiazole kinase